MRWSFIICLLLVNAVLAKPRPRPKRYLGHIKSIFLNKLFGSNKVVIAQPILPNNETYQLFKIPGYNDIVIKVSRKDKTEDTSKPDKEVDAVIVKPEIAIIGSYLGTTTQKETLLAIEMVKRLLESGILSAGRDIKELVVPMIPQPPHLEYYEDQNVLPLKVLTQEQGRVFVPMGVQQVDNRNAFPLYPVEYPPLIVSPAVKLTPVQSKYSYKQKGPDADMTYESYNNEDVIVTRTEKEPPLPQFIKLRIADAATIGANPYAIRQHLGINGAPVPIPYYVHPDMMMQGNVQGPYLSNNLPKPIRNEVAQPEFMRNNIYGGPLVVDKIPISLSEPLPVGAVNSPYQFVNTHQIVRCKEKIVGKMCPRENVQVKFNDQNVASKSDKPKQSEETVSKNEANKEKSNANSYSIAVNDFLKNHLVNGQLMSQYAYKQINNHSHDNYTEVRVGEAPQLKDITATRNNNLHTDYVFIPPKDVDSSMLNALSLNNDDDIGTARRQGDENAFISKIKTNQGMHVPSLKSNGRLKEDNLKQNPIVVSEQLYTEHEDKKSITERPKTDGAFETNKGNFDENRGRGDIPTGATY